MKAGSAAEIAIATAFFLFYTVGPVFAAQTNVELVIDDSGSMAQRVESEKKIDVAKRVLSGMLKDLPADAQIAVRTYGRQKPSREHDCADMELMTPFGPNSADRLLPAVQALKPNGMTPIAASLEEASKDFAGKDGQNNIIVLLSDGEEDCNGDPCAAAMRVHNAGIHLQVNVIGFHVGPKERTQLECVANGGGGKYYDAKNAAELKVATSEVSKRLESTPPATPTAAPTPSEFNLLSPANGGQLIAAPDESWQKAIDGNESDQVAVGVGQEGVFAFKDEKPATFSKFELLVADSEGGNIKDLELLAADDSPSGTYRSLGKFTAQNLRMMKTPYQEFTFPETTAKYFKLKVISNYGGSNLGKTYLSQVRLIGKPGGTLSEAAAATSTPVPEFNLLAAANGGQVIAAPDPSWQKAIDGNESDQVAVSLGQEGVFAFKEEKPATFSKFEMLVADSEGGNIKDFELLATDDSPSGTYRSLGKFTAQNLRMIKTPYQEFTFPETTAKYFKLKVISNYGGSNLGSTYLSQVRLIGKPGH